MTHSSQASGAPWSLERLIPVVTRHAKQLHRKQLRSYGVQTPVVAVIAHVFYGAVLGLLLQAR